MIEENISVKELFSKLAVNGCLGHPKGEPAYCYIRVSSAQQAEEGRTGLPRQLQHCHEVAQQNYLKIPWELVFADDGFSGFDFENRPAPNQLCPIKGKIHPEKMHTALLALWVTRRHEQLEELCPTA